MNESFKCVICNREMHKNYSFAESRFIEWAYHFIFRCISCGQEYAEEKRSLIHLDVPESTDEKPTVKPRG